ncbi:hypothetical protein OIU84_027332 [Salix udensis]|uniref:Uncharacterized protein n=1 Tax=Salix udensis TaxID=889485 RepID=A0AAD6PAV0_9ROSI|nr:hypothetical protein OIU84_027332 [Salix udensis]
MLQLLIRFFFLSSKDHTASYQNKVVFKQELQIEKREPRITSKDPIRYTLRHGCCTIPAIQIPPIEGSFCFIVAHSSLLPSRKPRVKLPVMKAPIMECDEILSPYSSREVPLIPDSMSLEYTKSLMTPIENNGMGHVDDIEKYDELIGNSERQLKVLNEEKTEIEEYVS